MLKPEDWSDVQMTIAHQIHSMKPEHLTPGRDVFLMGEDDGTLTVVTADRVTGIRYDAGRDLYDVTRKANAEDEEVEALLGVYCDQLGELAFGSEAKAWTLPFGAIIDADTGETIAEF